jgi:N-acetyl-anhydromuramyl-L-alanine amidase AmpD
LPEKQRDFTIDLCARLCREYQIKPNKIFGHGEIDKGKTCPGTGVDMNQFRTDVFAALNSAPPVDDLESKIEAEVVKIHRAFANIRGWVSDSRYENIRQHLIGG